MAPVKKERAEISAFERKRLENIAANKAILKDISTDAQKIAPPKPANRPKTTSSRKRATPVKKPDPRPTRTSSRIAGIEADSETLKRKAEVEYEFAKEEAKTKRLRVSGDLTFEDAVVDGKKFNKGENFLSGIMRGAQPNMRTFTEDDIKETTDEGLKALREKMSGLEIYEGWEPNREFVSMLSRRNLSNHRNQNHTRTGVCVRLPSISRQTSRFCWGQNGKYGHLRCIPDWTRNEG